MSNPSPPSPHKSLDPYEVADAGIFFGRERETEILFSDVVVQRLVVLFARTGTGKTSLINAGVRPRLHERDYASFLVRTSKDPAEAACRGVAGALGRRTLSGDSFSQRLEDAVRRAQQPMVLFFDQFEEFFIHVGAASEAGRRFIAEIAQLGRQREAGVHVVFSMREEFFVEMDAVREEIPTIFHNESNLRLGWFDLAQAKDAIVRPAQVHGVRFEHPLVERLLNDLAEGGPVASSPHACRSCATPSGATGKEARSRSPIIFALGARGTRSTRRCRFLADMAATGAIEERGQRRAAGALGQPSVRSGLVTPKPRTNTDSVPAATCSGR